MGKNIKSYATTPSPFPREREGSLTAKVVNPSFKIWYGLTVHIIRFYRQNFQFHQVKFQRITQIPRNLPTQSAN